MSGGLVLIPGLRIGTGAAEAMGAPITRGKALCDSGPGGSRSDRDGLLGGARRGVRRQQRRDFGLDTSLELHGDDQAVVVGRDAVH